MNMFGPDINIQVHKNPEEFLENNPDAVEDLVDVAQSAFNKEGVPTYEDTREHVLPVSTLITADVEGEGYQAFSSLDRLDDVVYEVGIAVDEDLQGQGLGSILLTKGVAEESNGAEVFGYRTQNPCMYACADKNFDIFPQTSRETPEEMQQVISALGEAIDDSKEMEGAVMKEAYSDVYDGGMYSEIPEHREATEFFEELGVNQSQGDALIVAGEVNEFDTAQQYLELVNRFMDRNYQRVLENGSPVEDPQIYNSEVHTFTHGPE